VDPLAQTVSELQGKVAALEASNAELRADLDAATEPEPAPAPAPSTAPAPEPAPKAKSGFGAFMAELFS
jgi:hypothetical protein